MQVLTIVIMIAAFIGMIVCSKVQKSKPAAKPLAFICLIIVIACAGKFMADTGAFGGDTSEIREQKASYARFTESTAKALADQINEQFPNEKLIIVANGGSEFAKQLTETSPANLIRKHLKNPANATIKGLPTPAPKAGEDMMPEEMNKAKYYNDLFDQNADTKLFVFATDLPFEPQELAKIKIWGKKNGPKVALLSLSDFKPFYNEVKGGVVIAAVMMRPDLKQEDFDALAPENLDEAFKARYLMINAKTLDQIAKKYFKK